MGGTTTAGAADFERLDECVNFAVKGVRPGARPVLLHPEEFEMQKFAFGWVMPDGKMIDRTQEHVARIKQNIDTYQAILARHV